MEQQTTIIEVNGVKLEVDLRTAKRVDQLRIGDRVKCLAKNYNGMSTHAGVVVGFEPFPSLPTIVVAYLDTGYASGTLKFQSFNKETKDFEIVSDLDNNALEVDKASILAGFAREEAKLEQDLQNVRDKRNFFLAHFGRYFNTAVPQTA
jgi:hypothetical protein